MCIHCSNSHILFCSVDQSHWCVALSLETLLGLSLIWGISIHLLCTIFMVFALGIKLEIVQNDSTQPCSRECQTLISHLSPCLILYMSLLHYTNTWGKLGLTERASLDNSHLKSSVASPFQTHLVPLRRVSTCPRLKIHICN